MTQETLPLLSSHDHDAPIAWNDGKAVTQQQFLRQARLLAERLPPGDHAINLCENRYHFLLVFAAMLLRGTVNLLPANRSINELQDIAARYDHCPCIVDEQQPGLELEQYVIGLDEIDGEGTEAIPMIPASQQCAVIFTSGSTGQSVPWEKRWGELCRGAKLTERMLGLDKAGQTVIATVPPQHMYGLETTIVLPLVTGITLDSNRPLFPLTLQHVLQSIPVPRILVTTPAHLRACLETTDIVWPKLERIISATAPLTTELAQRAECAFNCPLQEIYGSTETGAIATRRTSIDDTWRLHQGLRMETADEGDDSVNVMGGHLPQPFTLHDRIRRNDEERFTLLGRNSDMIKIAGKRVSLGDLNHKLLAIPGVKDGVFVETDGAQAVSRLCALVVAPGLTKKEIVDALRMQVDPVCLPRPLYLISELPRTEAGKLPRQAILDLLAQLRKA